jgi:prevent-host-death family protein
MDTISVSELRRTLGAVLDDLGEDGHAVYVTRYGHPVAVLVDCQHYERLKARAARVDAGSPTASSGKDVHPRPGAQDPIVTTPISNLSALSQVLNEGYAGDALADTEALYDEV